MADQRILPSLLDFPDEEGMGSWNGSCRKVVSVQNGQVKNLVLHGYEVFRDLR